METSTGVASCGCGAGAHQPLLIAQVAQTAVCNRHHSLGQQLSRWLLTSLDGHLRVIDRGALLRRSCECYLSVKKEYDRLLP